MPDAAAIVANFDGILGACLLDGYVPIPGFKRHANFGLQSLFAFIDTQEGRSARMTRDIDVPIGEEPMRLLRDEKNCVRAVASRKLSKAVEIDGPCGECGGSLSSRFALGSRLALGSRFALSSRLALGGRLALGSRLRSQQPSCSQQKSLAMGAASLTPTSSWFPAHSFASSWLNLLPKRR